MPSSLYVPILLAGMIITGSSNSLWSKWQDMQCVENCSDPNPHNHVLYEQPVWQTLQMFVGEMFCFFPVLYTWLHSRYQSSPVFLASDPDDDEPTSSKSAAPEDELKGWKLLLLWFPAACDLTGTTVRLFFWNSIDLIHHVQFYLFFFGAHICFRASYAPLQLMNVGLLYTPVSIYQMTRGALVLFVGILSVFFLRRRLWLYQWISLLTVVVGVSLVGYSGSLIKDAVEESAHLLASGGVMSEPTSQDDLAKVLVGVFFVLFAQIFTAAQFVIEEKIMTRWSVAPLVAVAYEGLFGAISILFLMPVMAQRFASQSPFFDFPRGWHQTVDNPSVLWSGVAIACSISLFNYFGLSVTRHVSATARSLTDTCRTLSIWLVSLGLGWEKLLFPVSILQVLGFGLLVYGTFLFNSLVKPPAFLLPIPTPITAPEDVDAEEAEDLFASSRLDESAALPVDLGQSGYDVLPSNEHVKAKGVVVTEE
ncbi:hypothetical protein EDC04DRAFT_2900671 [Pisolithus marmoratus]|nr:hypothetical protein EDC04DRAFT_2900671 [Pisolithus marmoratus]